MAHHFLLDKWPWGAALALLLLGIWRLAGARTIQNLAARGSLPQGRRRSAEAALFILGGLVLGTSAAGWVKLPWVKAPAHLTYSVPPGWTDLSPGAALRGSAELPESFRRLLKADHDALAIDWRPGAPPAPKATMIAMRHSGGPITEQLMMRMWEQIRSQGKTPTEFIQPPANLSLNGVACGRLIARLNPATDPTAMVVYFIPIGPHSFSVISYTTRDSLLQGYSDTFESSARNTASSAPH